MGRWSRDVAAALVRVAEVRDEDIVLDVGTGIGSVVDAVTAIAPASHIVGLDPAAAYVSHARRTHSSARTRFIVGDAQCMPFDDSAFDRTLSLLALNFMPEPKRALAEMMRVTRRGGILASAVWDYGDGMQMLRTFWDAAVALRPADERLDERHMPLCRRGELTALWRTAGLREVTDETLTIGTPFAGFDDYWAPFLQKQGPAGHYVAALSPGDRENLRRELRHRLIGDGPERAFTLRASVWAARGVIP